MKDKEYLKNNGIDVDSSLEIFGSIELYEETIKDYLDSLEERINNLITYKEKSDLNNYKILVHAIKSDAKYLGLSDLIILATNHEMKSGSGDYNYVMFNFDELLREIERTTKVLSEYIGEEVVVKEIVPIREKQDKTILVVDDSDIIRNYINKIFQDSYNVIVATDGKEAIDAITLDPDKKIFAMFLDLNMPNLDGFEVLKFLEKNDYFEHIAVTIITGEDSKENVEEAFMYPVIDVISKPFNEARIKRTIKHALNLNKEEDVL
jgi:CheY-like chemotaxis protein